jgi:hypothetical protein
MLATPGVGTSAMVWDLRGFEDDCVSRHQSGCDLAACEMNRDWTLSLPFLSSLGFVTGPTVPWYNPDTNTQRRVSCNSVLSIRLLHSFWLEDYLRNLLHPGVTSYDFSLCQDQLLHISFALLNASEAKYCDSCLDRVQDILTGFPCSVVNSFAKSSAIRFNVSAYFITALCRSSTGTTFHCLNASRADLTAVSTSSFVEMGTSGKASNVEGLMP